MIQFSKHRINGHDHLYNPVVLFNFLGGVMERNEYDAYGEVRTTDAGYWERSSVIRNTITFTGRELDVLDNGSLKIMYYRARYYDSETGKTWHSVKTPYLPDSTYAKASA
jgi:RHS repeat-associated protein